MCQEEINLHIKLCRLDAGDEAELPPHLRRLTGKYVYESIQEQIITSQVRNTEYYDSRCVPLPATLLSTIKKRKYISEYPYITYRIAQNGLTLLGVALLDEDKYCPSMNSTSTPQAYPSHRLGKSRIC